MKILITGARGQVGYELTAALRKIGDVDASDRSMLDLADADAIVEAIRNQAPDLIVNAGAYTAVDRAESERELAFSINARAPGIMAEEAKRIGSVLIHYSTDYVFDGRQTTPYDETATPNPLNVYGESKLAGERAIATSNARAIVLRTSWVYSLRGSNFLLTMRRLAAEREELRVVNDQIGVPNWARTIAGTTASLVNRGLPYLAERAGLYHMSSSGQTTWYEFAAAIIGEKTKPRLVPIGTADYPTPARRPRFGVLRTERFERTFEVSLPPWRSALQSCLTSPAESSASA